MTETISPVVPVAFADLLESRALAHVATLGPRDEPQTTPVWFHWDGTHLRFGQTDGRQKLKNVRRDGRVAVSIVDPTNPFRYLELRGSVIRIDPDPDRNLVRTLSTKYLGHDQYQAPPGDYNVIVIEPVHTTSMG